MALSLKIQKELDSFFERAKTGDICEINYDWTNQSELGKYCYYQRVKYKVPCTAYRTRTAFGTWKYNVEMHSFTDMVNLNYSGFSNSEYVNLKLAEEKLAKEKEMAKTPAWERKEGKNPKGGLNAKGRASAKAQGHDLKAPVKSGDNPRRASFLARMAGNPGPERKPNGEPTRLLLSLQAWGASSKADAKKKAAAMSKRLEGKKNDTKKTKSK